MNRAQGLTVTWRCRVAALAWAVALTVGAGDSTATSGTGPQRASRAHRGEVRALWVQRTSLQSAAAIQRMVRAAATSGFNTLLVQVRGRGDAYYQSTLEPRGSLLARQPHSFDPLQEVLTAAHSEGLSVHAWVSVSLAASAAQLPAERSHIIYRYPEWLMVPQQIAAQLSRIDPRSPAYLGMLARWTRSRVDEIEGLYISPVRLDAAEHVAAVVRELASSYTLDGIHLDYMRYPSTDFDYSRDALAAFRSSVLPDLDAAQRRALDARMATEPAVYAAMFPERWHLFRRSRLTALLMKVRTAAKDARPGLVLSAAVVPDGAEAVSERLQDWRTWIDGGLLDAVCPMAYTSDAAQFAAQIRAVREVAGPAQVWAGIGAFRLSPDRTIDRIHVARGLGAHGVGLFSYDNLIDESLQPPDYLGQVGRAVFTETPLAGAQ